MTPPIRVARVEVDGAVSVLVSVDPAAVMLKLTASEVTVTLSPREANDVAFALAEAAERRATR